MIGFIFSFMVALFIFLVILGFINTIEIIKLCIEMKKDLICAKKIEAEIQRLKSIIKENEKLIVATPRQRATTNAPIEFYEGNVKGFTLYKLEPDEKGNLKTTNTKTNKVVEHFE